MGYANPDAIVETGWVADNLSNPSLRIVEVDVDTSAYDQGHVPGAIGFNWKSQLVDQVRRELLSKAQFEDLLSRTGIGNTHTVIFYGDNNNWFAAWAYWNFKYWGHQAPRS